MGYGISGWKGRRRLGDCGPWGLGGTGQVGVGVQVPVSAGGVGRPALLHLQKAQRESRVSLYLCELERWEMYLISKAGKKVIGKKV